LKLIKLILAFHERAKKIANFVPIFKIRELNILTEINRAKYTIKNNDLNAIDELSKKMNLEFDVLIESYKGVKSGGIG
jgi:hypothetical protein